MLTLFERAVLAHLIADWLLQNNWMALNKTNLRHPAAWVHAGIHAICLGLAIGPMGGAVLGLVHLVLDTRVPVDWWIRVYKGSATAPDARLIALWTDQVLHIAIIAVWVAFMAM